MVFNPLYYPKSFDKTQSQDPKRTQEAIDDELWRKIRKTAKTNGGLRELLEKTEMYFRLLEEHNGDKV